MNGSRGASMTRNAIRIWRGAFRGAVLRCRGRIPQHPPQTRSSRGIVGVTLGVTLQPYNTTAFPGNDLRPPLDSRRLRAAVDGEDEDSESNCRILNGSATEGGGTSHRIGSSSVRQSCDLAGSCVPRSGPTEDALSLGGVHGRLVWLWSSPADLRARLAPLSSSTWRTPG